VRIAGFKPVSATFERKQHAKQWAAQIETDMRSGRYLVGLGDHTLNDIVERYCATIIPTKKTGERQRQQLQTWCHYMGGMNFSSIRPAQIAAARDEIAKHRSPSSVVRYLAALSHVYTIAIKDWQLIESNPVRLISWPKEPRGRVRFLSDQEREKLLSACFRSRCRQLPDIVMLALLTGMRRGELLGLKWANVDLNRQRLILTETKNNERRQVPLVARSMEIMTLYAAGDKPLHNQDWYVFHAKNRPMIRLDLGHYWPQAVDRAGLADFRFHDLRHTAASYLAMTGATVNEIAEILGHKTLSMVKRYAHLTTAHSAKVLERMEKGVFD